jgi:hypothetical protein
MKAQLEGLAAELRRAQRDVARHEKARQEASKLIAGYGWYCHI